MTSLQMDVRLINVLSNNELEILTSLCGICKHTSYCKQQPSTLKPKDHETITHNCVTDYRTITPTFDVYLDIILRYIIIHF